MEIFELSIGIGVGVLLTLPLAFIATKRSEKKTRLLEQRAQAAERLAEIGTLTGGLAHEIKNPLSTVRLNIQLLEEDLDHMSATNADDLLLSEEIGRIKRRFESLNKETSRLKTILEDFLRFAGRMNLDLEPTDLNSMVREIIDFFKPQTDASNIHLRDQFHNSLPKVNLDAGVLKQAILNLLINAYQAMLDAKNNNQDSGGNDELILRTQRVKVHGKWEVQLHVLDTGPGISKEVIKKIFQPYFSSKRGGTGLGLPTSRRIVEEHGGHLTVISELGKGTEFTISLPEIE